MNLDHLSDQPAVAAPNAHHPSSQIPIIKKDFQQIHNVVLSICPPHNKQIKRTEHASAICLLKCVVSSYFLPLPLISDR